ncbi:MAG: KEOPS complex subunit Cgi121 [archaeon]|nr:KEOPS complex subunit Cgi121 [archaeon]
MLDSEGKKQEDEQKFNCTIVAGNVSISDVDVFLSRLKAIAHKYAVTIQAMDAELIAGEEHIKSAVEKAIRALKRKRSITSDLGLEILLYASGRRQIERALRMGVTEGEKKVAIVIVDERGEKDLEVVAEEVKRKIGIEEVPIRELESELSNSNKKERIKEFYNITEDEVNAVGEEKVKMLVLERVALLDVLK